MGLFWPTENDAKQPGKGDCRFTFAALCALKLLAQLGDANAENELNLEANCKEVR